MYNYRGKFIAPEVFSMELDYLKKHYNVLDLDKALEKLKNGTLPPYSLAITFDDGYKNFYDYAFPILKQHNLTATFFLPTNFILEKTPLWTDRLEFLGLKDDAKIRQGLKTHVDESRNLELIRLENQHQKKLDNFVGSNSVYAPLSLEMIKEMQNAGMKFGAHTQSHPILSKVNTLRLFNEIKGSKNLLEQNIGEISNVFCYPNGQPEDFNQDVLGGVKKAGFKWAITTIEGMNTKDTNPYILKRITMDNIKDQTTFVFALSGFRSFLRRLKSL